MYKSSGLKLLLQFLFQVGIFLSQVNCQTEYIKTIRPGAVWELEKGEGMGRYSLYYVTIPCETVKIASKEYHLVNVASSDSDQVCGSGGYAREDTLEKKIYFIPFEDEDLQEKLIIDYSLEQGDTFYLQNGWGNQTVKIVRPTNFFGYPVNFIDFGVSVNDGFREVGGLYSTGPLMECQGWVRVTDYQYVEPSCELVNIEDLIDPVEVVKLWPNPVVNELNISVNTNLVKLPILVKIRTILGELIFTQLLSSDEITVNLENRLRGLLVIEIWQGEKVFHKKMYKP